MPCACVTDTMIFDFHVSLWPARHRLHKSRFQDEDLATLGKILCLLDGILDGQVGLLGVPLKMVAVACTGG